MVIEPTREETMAVRRKATRRKATKRKPMKRKAPARRKSRKSGNVVNFKKYLETRKFLKDYVSRSQKSSSRTLMRSLKSRKCLRMVIKRLPKVFEAKAPRGISGPFFLC
jgi:hypothetical protein